MCEKAFNLTLSGMRVISSKVQQRLSSEKQGIMSLQLLSCAGYRGRYKGTSVLLEGLTYCLP